MADEQVIDLTPEQQAQAEQLSGIGIDLSPEQETQARRLSGQLDPLLDFTPDQLSALEISDPENFNIRREFLNRPDLRGKNDVIMRAALANQKVRARYDQPAAFKEVTENLPGLLKPAASVVEKLIAEQIPVVLRPAVRLAGAGKQLLDTAKTVTPGRATKAVLHFAGGLAKYAFNSIVGAASPFVPEEAKQDYRRRAAENLAASEQQISGLASGVKATALKAAQIAGIAKPFSEYDPTEARELFFADLDKVAAQEEMGRGKGAITRQIGGEVIAELEAAGKPIRPEEVASLSDPFTFYAYTKLFGAAGGLVPAEAKAAASSASRWVGEVGRDITGTALEGIGESARLLSTAASLAPKLVPPGLVAPIGPVALTKLVTKKAVDISEGVKSVGKQIRTGEFVSPSARLIADIAETAPAAIGDIAGGIAFDIGTTAAMAEFPEEEVGGGVGIGTAFGLIGAGRHVTRRVISGQEIAPRVWGGKNQITTSGPFKGSEFDTLHNTAYQTATPAIKQRVNAVREFLRKAAPGVDLFYVPDKAAFETSLINEGVPAADARLWADQSGVFVKDLNGKRAAFAIDIDAAPHESFHPFQDVIGETANNILNQKVKSAYTDAEFEREGMRYASRLGWDGRGDWRDFTLVASGEGYHATIEKLAQEAANIIKIGEGRETTPEEAKELGTRIFNNAFSDATAANPDTDPNILRRNIWRGILTEAEQKNLADNYAASELAAETWDAVFKHTGPGMKDPKGLIPKFARVAGNLVAMMGGEPLAGRESQIGELPLKRAAVDVVRGAVRGRIETPPLISGEAAIPRTSVKPSPSAPTRPGAPVGTPEQEAEITKTVAAAAPEQPTGPEVDAQSPREILGTFAESKATGQGVKITRRTAPGTPAGAIEVSRGKRREQIETARGIPDDQKPLWEKNFTPVKTVVLNDGSIQEQGWSPEVLAANAEKTAKFLSDTNPSLSPFEIDTTQKTFTASGWKNLFDKVNIFAANQATGLTGKGTPLVIGRAREFGFFEPVGTREAAGTLTDAEANFINYLFGFPLPGKGPVLKRGGKAQFGEQLITEATEPGRAQPLVEPRTFGSKQAEQLGFAGEQLLEVNPLRTQIEQAGANPPSLIEAWQNLNLRDIVRADIAPELPAVRPVGVTLRAGFQPMPANKMAIRSPAMKDEKTGRIYEGVIHASAQETAEQSGANGPFIRGFTTNRELSKGEREFLDADEAFARAEQIGQLPDQVHSALKFSPKRKEIELIGPDGLKYKASFDGYMDMSLIGLGQVPQITPLVDLPGSKVKGSTTYGPSLEKAGYKLPADLPPPEVAESGEAKFSPPKKDERTGVEFTKFFSDVSAGKFGKSDVPFKPLQDLSDVANVEAERLKHWGNFENHIQRSIPMIHEEKTRLADGIIKTFGADGARLLDIGSSEGDFGKTISALTDGKIETVSLEPNPDMAADFHRISTAKGATITEDAFLNGFENHPAHEPAQPYDIINEAVTFQFINPNRDAQVAEVKRMLKPDGIFLSVEKFKTDNWAANEAKKDKDFKDKYFTKSELAEKESRVGYQQSKVETKSVGMVDNMVSDASYVNTLQNHFKHIIQYWDSGNFKGFAASDNLPKLQELVANIGNLNSEFSTVQTPREVSFAPNAAIKKVSSKYRNEEGIKSRVRPVVTKFNEDTAKEIADYYDAQPKNVVTPAARKSYDAFNQETRRQYESLLDAGYVLEPWKGKGEPYADSAAMRADLQDNKHLFYFPSKSGLGKGEVQKNYPPMEDSGVVINGERVPYNDLFRAVHDVFGHGTEGRTFSMDGEFQAWQDHAQMYSDAAQSALALETLGLNSWFNAGKHLRKPDGSIPKKGDPDFVPLRDRDYAPRTIFEFPKNLIDKAVQLSPSKRKDKGYAAGEYWLGKTGLNYAPEGHLAWSDNNIGKAPAGKGSSIARTMLETERQGFLRTIVTGEGIEIDASVKYPEWKDVPRSYKEAIEDLQFSRELPVFFDGKLISELPGAKFSPKREQFEDAETIREALSSPGWAVIGNTQEAVGKWNTPANIESAKALEAALQAQGYEYVPVKGTYKGVPQGVDYLVLGISTYDAQALGKKYKQESVLTPKGLLYGDGTFTPGDVENTMLGAGARKQEFFSTLPNGLSFSVPLDFSKAPYKPVGEQSTLFGGREYESPANFTQAELKQRYPEAVVPGNSKEKIGSDIINSPLHKQSDNPVSAFADKLIEFAKQYEDNPVYQLGLRWYSDIVPMLKKEFGADAPMMTELLAASSPNEKPDMNFFYAVDALEGFKSGRFDKIVSKFNEGFELYKSDKWLSWYNRELEAGNIVNPPQNPTPEAFLANWIYKHDLKPKQSNGQLYGFHGKAILEVLAGKWLQQNKGPKVGNFVQNLQGTGHEATIDVWADRTMRRIGYADARNRWRIMPANGEGVSDADFAFSQKAFRAAADKLGIEADALQGGLWFAEKSLWSENGWGRLDLGSYAVEMGKLPMIRQAIKQRLTKTAQRAKVAPMKTGELQFSPAKKQTLAFPIRDGEVILKDLTKQTAQDDENQIDVQPRPTRNY